MKDSLGLNFGLIIAFLLPGFIFLYGASFSVVPIAVSFQGAAAKETTVGAFLIVMLASLAVGLLLSAFRWFVLDHLFSWMGIGKETLDFDQLRKPEALAAFHAVVENHYRYYQYYANSLMAIVGAVVMHLFFGDKPIPCGMWLLVAAALLVLFLGARNALAKYYERARSVLGVLKTGGSQ